MDIYQTGNKRIEAHRIIQNAASDYLAAMFTNGFGESYQNEIELQGVDPDALKNLKTTRLLLTGMQINQLFII